MDFHLPDYLYAGLTENKTGEVRPLLTRLSLWPNCPRFVVIPSTHLWQKAQLTTRRWTIFGQTILCQTGPKFSLICPTWHLVPSTLLWQKISWPKLSVSQRLEQIACVTSFHKVWFNSSYKRQCIHAGLSLLNTCTSLYKSIQAYALYSIQVYASLNTMQLRCTLPFPEEVPHPRSHQHSTESIIFGAKILTLYFGPVSTVSIVENKKCGSTFKHFYYQPAEWKREN